MAQDAPSHRVPRGAVTEPLSNVIDPEAFTPRLVALLSNALVWRESHLLRRETGLGTNDWRVISALSTRPGSTSLELADFLNMNKALISKSVTVLRDRDLIVYSDGARGSKHLYLTRAGVEMHDRMRPISARGHDIIVEGMTAEEVATLNATLTRMLTLLQTSTGTVTHD